MSLYVMILLLLGGSGVVEIPLNGQHSDLGKTTKSGAMPLRIAVVQMKSLDHDIDGNLKQATKYADEAAAQGVQFILFPEFMATGSYLSFDTWDSAESSQGKSVQWLKSTSRRLHMWLGASFLEASGADFFDTFVLTAPSGDEAGRVRKQIPAGPEAYFLRGDVGPHVISTAIGKIGVGICAENYYCFAASQFLKDSRISS
jgi:N-carbamoylputrescine amidase